MEDLQDWYSSKMSYMIRAAGNDEQPSAAEQVETVAKREGWSTSLKQEILSLIELAQEEGASSGY